MKINSAHGGGGKLMNELIRDVFQKAFSNPILDAMEDAAVFPVPEGRMALTTDSFVVTPLFFPGRGHRPPRGMRHGERSLNARGDAPAT